MGKQYHSQAVRDLIWALETPSMVVHPMAVTAEEGIADMARNPGILGRFDNTGSELHTAVVNRTSDRLGEYFEILIRAWIEALPPAALLGAGKAVANGARTVGEFDLVFARDDEFHHWELGIKFYLGHPNLDGEPRWYGPNPKDRLDRKWRKMKEHQLRLGQTDAGREALRRMGVPRDREVIPAAFLKGYLFEPLDERYQVERYPETNPEVPTGWWVHRSQFDDYRDEIEQGRKMRYKQLGRLQWMSPALTDGHHGRTYAFESFEHRLNRAKTALVAGLVDGVEVTRGFVVPDRWPG